jgi:hypothetical protein
VDPAATLALHRAELERLPAGYRHLGYLQQRLGLPVKDDMPGLTGPAVARLYARGADWLAGKPLGDPVQTLPATDQG